MSPEIWVGVLGVLATLLINATTIVLTAIGMRRKAAAAEVKSHGERMDGMATEMKEMRTQLEMCRSQLAACEGARMELLVENVSLRKKIEAAG